VANDEKLYSAVELNYVCFLNPYAALRLVRRQPLPNFFQLWEDLTSWLI